MGKVNKNIKQKAKNAINKTTSKLQEKLASETEDTNKLLLHKTLTPIKSTTISKKDKLRRKHKNLLNKFKTQKKQRKEENARKQREKAAVTGDMKPLKDALPSLDELFKLSKQKDDIKTGVKEFDEPTQKLSVKQKLKQKSQKFISQVNSYQALLQDPDFKKNPRDVIAYHIKYTHGLIDE